MENSYFLATDSNSRKSNDTENTYQLHVFSVAFLPIMIIRLLRMAASELTF